MDNPIIPKLRELLEATQVTQKDLAVKLGIKPSHMNLFFKSKSDIHSKKLISILECLGIDMNQLIEDRIQQIRVSEHKVDSSTLYSKLTRLEDYNREPLLRIIKTLVG